MNTIKEKLFGTLGSIGCVIYYLLIMTIAVMPIVMIDPPGIINWLLIAIVIFFPTLSAPVWIWGLVCAVMGPQDVFAIIYYVLFGIMWLPCFISIVFSFFRRDQ